MLQKGSRIIITSSELAPLDPLPFNGIYGITKSVLEKYAFSLRMETNLLGIPVSIIRPGAVNTGLLDASTKAISRFVENTKMYKCNAEKFGKIVDSVESRHIPPEKIADLVMDALDNIESRRVLARACDKCGVPMVFGAISGWLAQAALSMPGDGFVEKLYPADVEIKDKSALAFTPALCAAMQCALGVRLLCGREIKNSSLKYFDLLNMEFEAIDLA
jgi:hypothetical protein